MREEASKNLLRFIPHPSKLADKQTSEARERFLAGFTRFPTTEIPRETLATAHPSRLIPRLALCSAKQQVTAPLGKVG
jgi:hypothetical protein